MIVKRWLSALFGSAVLLGGATSVQAAGEVTCKVGQQSYQFRPSGKALKLGDYAQGGGVRPGTYLKIPDIPGESAQKLGKEPGAMIKCGDSVFVKAGPMFKDVIVSSKMLQKVETQPYAKSGS